MNEFKFKLRFTCDQQKQKKATDEYLLPAIGG